MRHFMNSCCKAGFIRGTRCSNKAVSTSSGNVVVRTATPILDETSLSKGLFGSRREIVMLDNYCEEQAVFSCLASGSRLCSPHQPKVTRFVDIYTNNWKWLWTPFRMINRAVDNRRHHHPHGVFGNIIPTLDNQLSFV